MERTEIDGVPVVWEQGPAPLRATLTFGCGVRDETFRTIGIMHLVEHLAMSTLPRVHYEHNAMVDLTTTAFTVCGRPEQVVEFLDRVCQAVGNLPLDRIGKEAGVLTAEGGASAPPTVGALLSQRFGPQWVGLEPWAGPGFDRLTSDHVRAYVSRFFVAGNAVLHLTGPPPAGLRLPLPTGPRAEHPAPALRPEPGPLWAAHPVPSVGAALLGERGASWAMGMSVLAERLERTARHDEGLSYEVGGTVVPLDGVGRLYAVTVDAREGQEERVAGLLWSELRRMAGEGPTAEELAHECAGAREAYGDPRYVEVEAEAAAMAELFGLDYRPRDERLAEMAAVTPADVRNRFAGAIDTVHLVVPCDVRIDLPGLAEGGCGRTRTEPAGQVFKPPMLAKVLSRGARGMRLTLTADGLALRDSDGDVHEVRFADIVGVEVYERERLVFGRSGCIIPVDPDLFRGAEAAVRAVDANVPPHLFYQRSELVPADD